MCYMLWKGGDTRNILVEENLCLSEAELSSWTCINGKSDVQHNLPQACGNVCVHVLYRRDESDRFCYLYDFCPEFKHRELDVGPQARKIFTLSRIASMRCNGFVTFNQPYFNRNKSFPRWARMKMIGISPLFLLKHDRYSLLRRLSIFGIHSRSSLKGKKR